MPPSLSSDLLDQLARDSSLFHLDAVGNPIQRALTRAPLQAIADSVEPGMRTLETGCGGSTVVFAALGTRHTVVTPATGEVERVRRLCSENGIALDDVEFRIGSSDVVLRGWAEPVDVLLIDGAHRFPFPIVDWHFGAAGMPVGGRVLLDDVPIPAVHLLYDFLSRDPHWKLLGVPADKLAVFEKVAELPDGAAGDWELQRFNLPWRYDHVPWSRRWRRTRDRAMIGTRIRRALGRTP